jgi:hypothetical protein
MQQSCEIGQFKVNYEALAFKKSSKPNKFGTMFYLTDKIHLQKTLNPVTDYSLWTSDEGKPYVVLPFDANLKEELMKITSKLTALQADFLFKEVEDKQSHYIKLSPKIDLTNGLALSYVLEIFGIFQKTGNTAYLQMEIVEIRTKTYSRFVDGGDEGIN